ncbi:MAG: helix-hairpin-helix domain-containing protein [Promethearchaeota archaeon]
MVSKLSNAKTSEVNNPILFSKAVQGQTLILGPLKESIIDLPGILAFFLRNMSRVLFLVTNRQAHRQLLGLFVRRELPVISHGVTHSTVDFTAEGIHLLTIQLFGQRVTQEQLQKQPFDLVIFWEAEKLGRLKTDHPFRNLLSFLPKQRLAYGEHFGNETAVLRICQLLDLCEVYGQATVELQVEVQYIPLPGSYLSVLTALKHVEKEIRTEASQQGIKLPTKGKKSLLTFQQRLSREYDGHPQTNKSILYTAMLIRVSQLQEAVTDSGLVQANALLQQWQKQVNKSSILKLLRYPKINLLAQLVQKYPLPHPKIHTVKNILNTQKGQQCVVVTATQASAQTIHKDLEIPHNLLLKKTKAADRRHILNEFYENKSPIITTLAGLAQIKTADWIICWQPIPFHKLQVLDCTQGFLVLVTKGSTEEGIYWKYHHQRKRLQQFVQEDVEVSVARLQDHRQNSVSETEEYLDKFVPQSLGRKEAEERPPRYLEVVENLLPLVQPVLKDPAWTVQVVPPSDKGIPWIKCNVKDIFLVMRDEELLQDEKTLLTSIENWQLQDKRVRILCYTSSAILHHVRVISKVIKIADEMGASLIFQPIQADNRIMELIQELVPQSRRKTNKIKSTELSEIAGNLRQIWIKMLTGIPGINQRKASEIINEFGSLHTLMLEGTTLKLQKVHGIGKKLAAKISQVLGLWTIT